MSEQERDFFFLLILMIKGIHIPNRRFGKFIKEKFKKKKNFPESHHPEINTLTFCILSLQDHFWKTKFYVDKLYSGHTIWQIKGKLPFAHWFIHPSRGAQPVSVAAMKVRELRITIRKQECTESGFLWIHLTKDQFRCVASPTGKPKNLCRLYLH